MKKPFRVLGTISAITLMSVTSLAQAQSRPLCSLASPNHNPQTDNNPPPFAWASMGDVNSVLCARFRCPNYSFWSNPNSGNAMASLSQQEGYVIRYNPGFMNQVLGNFGGNATTAILAHELGHIIDFSSRPEGNISSADREATADQYAGCAFALAGSPRNSLFPIAQTLHAMGASPGYPTPSERVSLVVSGYDSCLR